MISPHLGITFLEKGKVFTGTNVTNGTHIHAIEQMFFEGESYFLTFFFPYLFLHDIDANFIPPNRKLLKVATNSAYLVIPQAVDNFLTLIILF